MAIDHWSLIKHFLLENAACVVSRHLKQYDPIVGSEKIELIFEDENLIVINKPPGLLTMATSTERTRTAYALLRASLNNKRNPEKVFIVHRLDREASGLLVFAKTPATKEHLQDQFKDHSAGRRYAAVVDGRLREGSFTIESYLAENAAYRVYSTSNRNLGKRAVTHVKVLKSASRSSLVEVRLETGRKHQIRVHLAERGHPILGDKTYGAVASPLRRLALHAFQLDFTHPVTGTSMILRSPYPREFDALVRS